MVSILSGVRSLGHAEQWTLSFGSICSFRFSWAQPSLADLFFCKTTDTTESLRCMTPLLETSVDTCSLCQQGRSVCPASCWIKTSEEGGVPKPGFLRHGTLWMVLIPLEWGHGHQRLSGTGFISWLLPASPDFVCLSPNQLRRDILEVRGQMSASSFSCLG